MAELLTEEAAAADGEHSLSVNGSCDAETSGCAADERGARGDGWHRPATVLVADDHPLFVHAVCVVLATHGFDVVGSTGRGDEVVSLVEELSPDVVLLDIFMPGMDGFQCLGALRDGDDMVTVIAVSADERPEIVDQALELGAICFVGKSVELEDFARAVALVTDKSPVVLPNRMTRREAGVPVCEVNQASHPVGTLTKRETEIVTLATEGHTNAEIARLLWVTEQTVKFHLSNIYRKLDVTNRTQAGAKARKLGILDDDGEPASVDGAMHHHLRQVVSRAV